MLHDWAIDEREFRRHEARRGRRYAYEHLDPARSALIVVDLVPFFVDENRYARGIIPNVNRLAATVRARGGLVAWTVPAVAAPTGSAVAFYGAEVAAYYARSGGDGAPRVRLATGLDIDHSDPVIEKTAPSALFPGRSPLPDLLVDRGVDTVVVAGTVANVCCESTVRDAFTLGYRTVMVADANAAVDDDALNATLRTVYRSFGDVRTTAETVALLERGA